MSSNPSLPLPNIDARERIDRIRLIRSENVGPVTFRQLMGRYGSARAALDALPDLARRGGRGRPLKIAPKAEVDREIARNEAAGAQLLVTGDPDYPIQLAATEDAPPVLSLIGHAHLLNERCVAIVGARNASANAIRYTRMLSEELGEAGYVVVSGMARGIDGAAHGGTLDTGTIAVLAGGVDVIYPKENTKLHGQVAEQGALIAESPIGTTPQARHFPSRNRIIAGLSLGVIVIEAAQRSGSLITARFAADQGREVFAVPGSPLDPRARGSNDLIRDGAHLVQTGEDVIAVLNSLSTSRLEDPERSGFGDFAPTPADPKQVETARERILELLGPSPVPVDEIIRQCQLSPTVVSIVLIEAELAGSVERHPGNQVARRFEAE